MVKTRYPGVLRTPEGRFRIRVKVRNPKTGKMMEIDRLVEARDAGAAAALRQQLREEVLNGTQNRAERTRLGDYARSWLLAREPGLKPSTADRYATTLEKHVVPALGDYYMDALMPDDLVRWRDAQKAKPSTVNSRLRILRTLLADATDELGLGRDPAARISAVREARVVDERDANRLTGPELATVLAALERDAPEWHALFLCLALTGARFGEASALKWSDIDEKTALIHIRRSQWQGIVDTTKTDRCRTVPMTPPLKTALDAQKDRLRAEDRLGEWVFPSRKGTLLRTASLRKPLLAALKAAEIERRHTVHGFRRTFNNLLRQVTTGEVVRAMTGHVTEAMTEHYSHVELGERRSAVDRMLELVGPEKPAAGGDGGPSGDRGGDRNDGTETAGEDASSNRP